jgi:predicted glycosyltransferase
MGGYNTICEIMSQQTPALIIPRETPRKEQLIRAECLKDRQLIDFIPWNEVSPQLLREKIFQILDHRDTYAESMARFKLTGLDTMTERITHFKAEDSSESRPERPLISAYAAHP